MNSSHEYTDDTQVYITMSLDDFETIQTLSESIDQINAGMSYNNLQLNRKKTELFWTQGGMI